MNKWPERKVFTGPGAHEQQREFAAHAFRDAETGVNYSHFQNGQQVSFIFTDAEMGLKKKPAAKGERHD